MTTRTTRIAGFGIVAACLAACAGPTGPAPTSPVAGEADAVCRRYAEEQVAPFRGQGSAQMVGSTLLGAGMGTALGAAVGSGAGSANAGMGLQQQYDTLYAGCIAARSGTSPAPPGGAAR